ncbi:sulfatase [Desertivirga arenae]|uniref:sulfatase n=1 Tax=Desertivirga arenae TaxID=2810309 RepID=UPI001A978FC5|nr:sulfatase [Pedobacter sp. SYSU D00823]
MKKYTAFLLLLLTLPRVFAQSKSPPNIVVFFIDDMGQQDLGCYGSDFYQTPAIDNLAKKGVRFTNAYSACTVCSPSRAALMTGKYPARLHITDWIQGKRMPWAKLAVPDWKMYLPLEEKTLAESLKERGYATWHVGKWHLGDDEKYWAENQGFDVNIAGNFKGSPNKKGEYNGYFSPYGLKRIEDGPKDEYLTDRLTNEALRLIAHHKAGTPFYLNLAHYAVHMPIQPKPDKLEKYKKLLKAPDPQKNPAYAAMIESVDESVARIITALEMRKLLENTLIVFATDNGALASVSTSKPFREGKGWAYEGGTRTPLLIYWKGKIDGGKVINEPAITMDIYATIMQIAGAVKPADVDGRSLLPVIQKGIHYDRPLFWHYPHYHNDKPHGSVRYQDWKLIQYFEDMHYELYNLKEDEGEGNDLAAHHPEKVKELADMLIAWREEVKAQMPAPNPDYQPAKAQQKGAGAE